MTVHAITVDNLDIYLGTARLLNPTPAVVVAVQATQATAINVVNLVRFFIISLSLNEVWRS